MMMSINYTVALFGFISGFLLLITGNTLNFWLSHYGAGKETIGLFSLVSMPYALNFLWAPLFDRIRLDFIKLNINFRLKWILVLHILGAFAVLYLAQLNPLEDTLKCAITAIIISFASSSQDIVLNAYRTELTPTKSKAQTSGLYIFGYRLGMIISGPLAIYSAEYISFHAIYSIFFIIYISFPFLLLSISLATHIPEKYSLHKELHFYGALKTLGNWKNILSVLLFFILYRLGDNFISVMLNPFLLNIGFEETEIALAGRLCGIMGSAFGGVLASYIMNNSNILNALFWFGILHGTAHLTYISIEYSGHNISMLILATLFDSITGGMTMAAYIGLMTCLCSGRYRTTQYAIFSAMMGVSRSILPSISGFVVIYTSWTSFFILSAAMIAPALLILKKFDRKITEILND